MDYDAMRDDLFSLKEALSFIALADESDAGGSTEFSGLAYARVAKEGLTYCEQAIERLEKATGGGDEGKAKKIPDMSLELPRIGDKLHFIGLCLMTGLTNGLPEEAIAGAGDILMGLVEDLEKVDSILYPKAEETKDRVRK